MESKTERIDLGLCQRDTVVRAQVQALFDEVDEDIEQLKQNTGIHCPEMCGICCLESEVDTTAIEMIPLAMELWETGRANFWLETIKSSNSKVCVFFKEVPETHGKGRCQIYAQRPLICRLFGFFTSKDKNGGYVYGGCKIIKKEYPEIHQKAVKMTTEGIHPSVVTNYSIRIISRGCDLSKKMIPINKAAEMAIEKIGFELTKKDWC